MFKLGNALIIDDEVGLTTDQPQKENIDSFAYKSLRNIQNFLLKNSIPYSVLNQLSESPIDALEKIKELPKPDMVVLDLDLNSNGEIDDLDITLIKLVLKYLFETHGYFIILIYSSQAEEWSKIQKELVQELPTLTLLLDDKNIIVLRKEEELDATMREKLGAEIIEKKRNYFNLAINKLDELVKSSWSKESIIITFFICFLLIIIQISYSQISNILFWAAIISIILTGLSFIAINKKNTHG